MYNKHKVLKLRFSMFLDHFIQQFPLTQKQRYKPRECKRSMTHLTFPLTSPLPQNPKTIKPSP